MWTLGCFLGESYKERFGEEKLLLFKLPGTLLDAVQTERDIACRCPSCQEHHLSKEHRKLPRTLLAVVQIKLPITLTVDVQMPRTLPVGVQIKLPSLSKMIRTLKM